jgi:WD40 repeat protein
MNVRKIAEFSGHDGAIYSLTQGRKAETFFSAGADKVVAEWNVKTLKAENFAIKLDSSIYSLLHILSKNYLLIGTSVGGIHVVDLLSKKELRYFTLHTEALFDLQYNATKNVFACASADGSFSIWDTHSLSLLYHIKLSVKKLRCLRYSPNGDVLAVCTGEGNIVLFETNTYKEIHSIQAHVMSANALCFHPNGKMLLSGGKDAYLKAWDLQNNFSEIQSIPAHNYAIYGICFHPTNPEIFATVSRDKNIKLWDATTFEVLVRIDKQHFQAHINSVNALFWSPFNNTLITCGDDRIIKLWEICTLVENKGE